MEFTREELAVIFQALHLTERYYSDPKRRVAGMHPASQDVASQRLRKLKPLIERITVYARDLS